MLKVQAYLEKIQINMFQKLANFLYSHSRSYREKIESKERVKEFEKLEKEGKLTNMTFSEIYRIFGIKDSFNDLESLI